MNPRPPAQPPSKHDMLMSLLDEGMTMLHLDARTPGVDVPESLRGDPHLRLNLSRRFGRPLEVKDDRVEAVLTFSGRAYRCVVPFTSVFGMSSHGTGKTLMWPEDIPAEVLAELERNISQPPAPRPKAQEPRPAKRLLRLAPPPPDEEPAEVGKAEDSPSEASPPVEPPPTPTPPRRGHLRLVK
ncbi:MAG: ClpXP protease specificity-enhancing factor SspB [Myxococcota bacterium]